MNKLYILVIDVVGIWKVSEAPGKLPEHKMYINRNWRQNNYLIKSNKIEMTWNASL